MKLIPVLTEKGLNLAKGGQYSFWVERGHTKNQIKKIIGEIYGVNVTGVRTMKYKGGTKKNLKGKTIRIKERKKAIVTLKKDEKIDVFEAKEKKK